MQGFPDEVILRFQRSERDAALCQSQWDYVVIEQEVLRQTFDNDRLLGISALFRDRDIQLFAEVFDHV